MTDQQFPAQNSALLRHYSSQGYYRGETLQGLLVHATSVCADGPAILSASRTLSYAELSVRVRGLAAGLQSLGLGKGHIIAVQLPNIPEYIISYLAITAIGGIMQTLHMPYRESELQYLLCDSNAAAIICLGRFRDISPAEMLQAMADKLPASLKVIAVGDSDNAALDFAELMNSQRTTRVTDIQPDDPFVLLYTSGTTSLPKGVPHRYNSFLTNARLCREEYGFTAADRLLSVAPMTHLYGLFAYNMTLSAAASAVLLAAFNPADFVECVRQFRPTAIFAAPAHFASCFQADLLRQVDFESVRFVCLSGSTVPPALAIQVDSLLLNGVVGQLWGMSELQAGAITRMDDADTVRYNFAGRATRGTELRVVDNDNRVLPGNKEGELQVKGLSVFDAYLNNTSATDKAFTDDGWFRTGDTAMLDEYGNLRITGRTKHLINRGGVKYNPVEIELLVNELAQVQQCAIIPVPDEVVGERACIFVVPARDNSITLDAITVALNKAGVAKFKWPEQLVIMDSLPMTPTNKIKLEELAKYLEQSNC